jgi:hypothetical protein
MHLTPEETFTSEVSKVEGKIYEVQRFPDSQIWVLVEKPDFTVIIEEARLWEVHGPDMAEFHRVMEADHKCSAGHIHWTTNQRMVCDSRHWGRRIEG